MNTVGKFALAILAAVLLTTQAAPATVDTAWVRRWDGSAHRGDWAEAIAIDSPGYVYVAGVTETDTVTGHYDIITLKYGPAGELLWARQYGNPGTLERPSAVAVDQQGYVYVAGYANHRIVTLKYSSAGQLLWSLPYGSQGGAADLALDSCGNILLCGGVERTADSFDLVTIKYRSSSDTAWVRLLDWAGGDEDARALAVGPWGGPCIVAAGYDGSPGNDYLTVRYDSSGNRLWLAVYDGPADWDSPADIAVDSAGNTYVTGSSQGDSSPWDYLTIKYDSTGETLWTRRYNGTANDWDQANAVVVDDNGNVYVTGYSTAQDTRFDYATLSYTPGGELRWTARYNGPGNLLDEAKALAVMPNGQAVVVTGYSYGGPTHRNDCTTIMYDTAGQQAWLHAYDGGGSDEGSAIVLGADLSIYVAGHAGQDMLVIKYAQNGGVKALPAPNLPRPRLTMEPSPFTTQARARFTVAVATEVRLLVFDAVGRRVRTLADGHAEAGSGAVAWDGTDDAGRQVTAGVYTVVLEARQVTARTKVLKLK